MITLLHSVFKLMGFKLSWKHIEHKEIKSKILNAIEAAMKIAPRDQCLAEIGLSISRYKRWRRERRGCAISNTKSCPRVNANQLTYQEVQKMKELVTSKEFSHFPIRSLHYYAKREGILYCSYSTCRKYIDHFKWQRARKKFRKRKFDIGIRANHPNEIWHLDLSYFILPNKTKCYIQAVVDNYSRYVLSWQILESFDGAKTGELLQRAIARARGENESEKILRLIVDGGSENKGREVERLEDEGNFRKEVARFEISFSNSMIETVFRSMKHNYLFHQEIRNHPALKKHVDFWITEHNNRIPHSSFNGETPLEKFKQSSNKETAIRIVVGYKEAKQLRISENQKVYCVKCDVA